MTNAEGTLKLDAAGFDDLLRRQDPFGEPGGRFDLRDVGFVSPAGLVQLVAACHALAAAGRQPVIALRDPHLAGYLVRAGIVRTVGKVACFDPPFRSEFLRRIRCHHGGNPYLIEATRIRRGVWLELLLDRIVDLLLERLRYPPGDAYDVAAGVSELCQNTFDHNGRECGFLALQVYGAGAERFLETGVADCGDGLTTTLCRNPRNPPLASDLDAVRRAVEVGVSRCDEPTRGQGLPHLLAIARKRGGVVRIRSGTAVCYRMDRDGHGREQAFAVPLLPGVQIAIALPAPSRP